MMARSNFIFVERAVCECRDEELPEAGCSAARHGMAAAIPLVEVTHDTHSRSVRCPDDEMDAGNTLQCPEMGAHGFIGFEEGSLGEQMQFKVGKEGWKCIGIMTLGYLSRMIGCAETIGSASEWPRDDGFKQAVLMETLHRNRSALPTEEQGHFIGFR